MSLVQMINKNTDIPMRVQKNIAISVSLAWTLKKIADRIMTIQESILDYYCIYCRGNLFAIIKRTEVIKNSKSTEQNRGVLKCKLPVGILIVNAAISPECKLEKNPRNKLTAIRQSSIKLLLQEYIKTPAFFLNYHDCHLSMYRYSLLIL